LQLLLPVIQLPLLVGGGKLAGLTHDPGAQLLLISAGLYVKPRGPGGLVENHCETLHTGSSVPTAPCPVDKLAGFGNTCALTLNRANMKPVNSTKFLTRIN
jgi:hypothetical protein